MASNPNLVKVSTIAGTSVLVLLLDLFFLTYMTSYHLVAKVQDLHLGGFTLGIPIQWLPVIGVFLVALVVWSDVFTRIFPRRTGPETDQLGNMRIMRVIALSMMAFVCVLYVPYVFGSNWFLTTLSHLSRSVSSFIGVGMFLVSQQALMTMNPVWQYAASQVLATGAMVVVAWALARPSRRAKKQR